MVSKAKLYSKLDDLVFCVKPFNPFRELRHSTDKLTEELIDMGSQILSLREKLGEPSKGTIAERICWYCREWGNTDKHHRSSGAGLAKQFLAEIEKI